MGPIARQRVIRFLSNMTGVCSEKLQCLPDDELQEFAATLVAIQQD